MKIGPAWFEVFGELVHEVQNIINRQLSEVVFTKLGTEPGLVCVGLRPRGLKRKVGRSSMTGDCHVTVYEGLGVKLPRAIRPLSTEWGPSK